MGIVQSEWDRCQWQWSFGTKVEGYYKFRDTLFCLGILWLFIIFSKSVEYTLWSICPFRRRSDDIKLMHSKHWPFNQSLRISQAFISPALARSL